MNLTTLPVSLRRGCARVLLVLLTALLAGCWALPQDPLILPEGHVPYQPVSAWWNYYEGHTDDNWDYFSPVTDPDASVLLKFYQDQHPEAYRVAPASQSEVIAYNKYAAMRSREEAAELARDAAMDVPVHASMPAPAPVAPAPVAPAPVASAPAPLVFATAAVGRESEVPPLLASPQPETAPPVHFAAIPTRYAILVGQFAAKEEADLSGRRIWALGQPIYQKVNEFKDGTVRYDVHAGPYRDQAGAEEAFGQLREAMRRVDPGDVFEGEIVPYAP